MICLLPAGRCAIENAAPQHVHNVRRHFIDLLTPADLDTLAALGESCASSPRNPRPDFPQPEVVLDMGKVWKRETAAAWARAHGREVSD